MFRGNIYFVTCVGQTSLPIGAGKAPRLTTLRDFLGEYSLSFSAQLRC